jgi:hypothetical protein
VIAAVYLFHNRVVQKLKFLNNFLIILLMSISFRKIAYRLRIPFKSQPGEGLLAGLARVGYLPESLTFADIRQMHLYRRDPDCLQRVEDGNACVRLGRRVDHDAVKAAVRRLNRVHNRPLVV